MNKSAIAILIALTCTAVYANAQATESVNNNVATTSSAIAQLNDDLPYFNAKREAAQQVAHQFDFTGQSYAEAGKALGEFDNERNLELHKVAPEQRELALEIAAAAIENGKSLVPEYIEMLQGIADVRNTPLVDIVAAGLMVDVNIDTAMTGTALEDYVSTDKGCTTIAFNNGLVGQTLDFPIEHIKGHSTIVKMDDVIGVYTDGGFYQQMGKHVGVTVNFLGQSSIKKATKLDDVVALDVLMHAVAKAESVDAAITIVEKYNTIVAMNFTIADDQGGYAAVITLGEETIVQRGSDKGVAHTNHSEALAGELVEGVSDAEYTAINQKLVWSFARKDFADNFLRYTPEMTVESMQYLFEQKPVNMSKHDGKTFVTTNAYVFDTVNGCAYYAPENPLFLEGDYTKVCF